ncbi:MAG: ATP-binding protein [Sandaracinaceae bacterium]|nr:ATP-binding protein [Sandaracinaceae bacterium]
MIRRISTKLTLAASVAITIVTLFNALQRVQRERDLFQGEVRRDHEVLGTALAETTGALVERAGVEEALYTVEDLNARRAHVNLRWVLDDEGRARSEIVDRDGEHVLETHVPVETASGPAGYIEITESLTRHERYMRDSVLRIGMWALVTILASAVLVHLAGWLILARPLSPILRKIHRVGMGDLSGPLAMKRGDELGAIAHELDQMCAQLSGPPGARRGGDGGAHRRPRAAPARRPPRHGGQARLGRRARARHAAQRGLRAREDDPPRRVRGRGRDPRGRPRDRGAGRAHDAHHPAAPRLRAAPQGEPRAGRPARPRRLRPLHARAARGEGPRHAGARRGAPVEAEVDVGQIQQVMTNLVVNAIQAQPEGGRVDVRVQAESDRVLLGVDDHGPGMPDDVRERIFEPFFTTKEVGEGTGLGLSVVHGIVMEHGGRIEVARSDRGTCFEVSLPRGAAS